MASEDEFDLALLDIEMPRLGDWETLPRLKVAHPDVRVVLMTGSGCTGRSTAKRAGADAFLPKPFALTVLPSAVDGACGEREASPLKLRQLR